MTKIRSSELLPNSPLKGGRFASERDVPSHHHSATELVYITEGYCTNTSGKVLSGGRESMFIFPPNYPHNQLNREFTKTTYVTFRPCPVFFDDTPRIMFVASDDPASVWIEQLVDLILSSDEEDSDCITSLLHTFLLRLKKLEGYRRSHRKLHPAVVCVKEKMDRYYLSTFDAKHLAVEAEISVSHMNALFRGELGVSPLQYQLNLRLEHARRLLSDHRLQIQEIARFSGFNDTNYFIRLFKRKTGSSPGEFRKRSCFFK